MTFIVFMVVTSNFVYFFRYYIPYNPYIIESNKMNR